MNNIPKEEFELALKQCATEPIHQLGNIQPHGAVLVISSDSLRTVLQVSQNLEEFVDLPSGESFGKSLSDLLGETAGTQVEKLIQVAETKNTAAGVISIIHNNSHHDLPSHLYVSDGMFVLELAHDEVSPLDEQLPHLLFEFQQSLLNSESDSDINKYLDAIATFVRALTKYDSVMIYRFDAHWNGEVISQEHIPSAPSYKGMHFPASDIPPQARRLYSTNLVRVVVDIDATPVPVLPTLNPVTGKLLDMTYSALRSLSPIHIEYLRNIGIHASMTISLMQNDRLWGLIACHHMSPKMSTIAMREGAIFISQMASTKLSSFEAIEQNRKADRANSIVHRLLKSISSQASDAIIQSILPELEQLLDSSGMILAVEGKIYLHGEVPNPEEIDDLLKWLGSQGNSEIFSCDYLGERFAPATNYADKAAGLLTTPLSREMSNYIIWIRKEKPQMINWAGKYEEGFVQNTAGDYRLTPRKSFELWTESWHGRCTPWTNVEIGIASMLALALPESLAQKRRLEEEQHKLKQAEEEIRMLAFYDSLTKLPNRRLLFDRLSQAIASSKRSRCYLSIFFIDLDNFKPVNDTHGHGAGDLLLVEVATRLRNCLREIDTAARFGGDEFVVIINELVEDKKESRLQAISIAEKVQAALAEPYFLQLNLGKEIKHICTSSIGVVVFLGEKSNETDIMKLVDQAMYKAKESGKNRIIYSEL